jgi:mannitol-1-/sugar-/sorbitol-6-phosphatase
MEFRCSAFLFDLDGVLVDSLTVVERACRRWAERHHLDPETVVRVAHGRRSSDTVRALAPHLDVEREAAWIDALELSDVEGLRAVRGAAALLASLPADAWGIVTSCGPELAHLRLTSVGLPVPPMLVTSDLVSRGKPAPDGYRLGAKRLGRRPEACVVFEDAPAGIAAGVAAGARVIALRTTDPGADFTGAGAIIDDLTGVRARRNQGTYALTIEC